MKVKALIVEKGLTTSLWNISRNKKESCRKRSRAEDETRLRAKRTAKTIHVQQEQQQPIQSNLREVLLV